MIGYSKVLRIIYCLFVCAHITVGQSVLYTTTECDNITGTCQPLPTWRDVIFLNATYPLNPGSVVSYDCRERYQFVDDVEEPTITCLEGGQWWPEILACESITNDTADEIYWEPVESEYGMIIGLSFSSFFGLCLILLLILDICTCHKDAKNKCCNGMFKKTKDNENKEKSLKNKEKTMLVKEAKKNPVGGEFDTLIKKESKPSSGGRNVVVMSNGGNGVNVRPSVPPVESGVSVGSSAGTSGLNHPIRPAYDEDIW